MKICVISPKGFPVPAIKGGAVETLITNFIDENEVQKKVFVDLVTIKEKSLNEIKVKYMCTRFIDVNLQNALIRFLKKIESENNFIKRCRGKLENIIYNKNIIKTIKNNEYDFVIFEGGNPYNYAPVYKYIPKEKSILHVHGVSHGNVFWEKNFGYFLGISYFVNKQLTESKLIAPNRAKLLYNCININDFQIKLSDDEKKVQREKFKIRPNEKVILFCGRTVKEKGVRELLLAYQMIKNKENTKLLIVGNSNFADEMALSDYEKELRDIANKLKDRVVFTGHVYNRELYKIYNIADIAVFPHLCEEGFGLTLVEAMASGVPIITTNSGAIPELVSDKCSIMLQKEDLNDLIENIASSIEMLLDNDELRKTMGAAGMKIAEKFSSKNYYDNFIKILEELKNEK